METQDQRFYTVDGQQKAEIDVYITNEVEAPAIMQCRHAVLQLHNQGNGYVVYDRLLCRIVNGVFYGNDGGLNSALEVARQYNEQPDAQQDMAPNGFALGLKYP